MALTMVHLGEPWGEDRTEWGEECTEGQDLAARAGRALPQRAGGGQRGRVWTVSKPEAPAPPRGLLVSSGDP